MSKKYTPVVFALLLGVGGWRANRLLSDRSDLVFLTAVPTMNRVTLPAPATGPASHFMDLSFHFDDSFDDGRQHQLTPGIEPGTLPRDRQIFGAVEFDIHGIVRLISRGFLASLEPQRLEACGAD
jgi:hypothetical protein